MGINNKDKGFLRVDETPGLLNDLLNIEDVNRIPLPQQAKRITQDAIPKPLNHAQFIGKPEIDPSLINEIVKILKGKTVTESQFILEEAFKWIKANARV